MLQASQAMIPASAQKRAQQLYFLARTNVASCYEKETKTRRSKARRSERCTAPPFASSWPKCALQTKSWNAGHDGT